MSIISKLFGSDKVINAGLDVIDKVWYTKEEQADAEIVKAKLKMEWQKLYHPYKLAQRIMMMAVTGAFVGMMLVLFLMWIGCVIYMMFSGSSEMFDFLKAEIYEMIELTIKAFGIPFFTILGFYFGMGEVDVAEWAKNRGKK